MLFLGKGKKHQTHNVKGIVTFVRREYLKSSNKLFKQLYDKRDRIEIEIAVENYIEKCLWS